MDRRWRGDCLDRRFGHSDGSARDRSAAADWPTAQGQAVPAARTTPRGNARMMPERASTRSAPAAWIGAAYDAGVTPFSKVAACAVTAAVAVLASGCGQPAGSGQVNSAAGRSSSPAPGAAESPAPTPAASSMPPRWPVVVAVPAARAGEHQTSQRPPASSGIFRAEMTDLWAAIASGRPGLARPAFFPLVAYEEVKAIADPAADWQNRLVAEFTADVVAAHRSLAGHGRRASLVRVIVPESEAGWILPGQCDNNIGYWHVAGARLVYRVGGRERSFGIATLISWRGRWYVVHLGGELRTGAGGMLDAPSAGPGTPGPPGGC